MVHFIPPDPPAIVGSASAIDGDTLEIEGQRISLWGIDAPERGQMCSRANVRFDCGLEATAHLNGLIRDRTISCSPKSPDGRRQWTVAVCRISYGFSDGDVAEEMVRSGWALEARRTGRGEYAAAQTYARSLRLGLWMGRFQRPWEWRANER